VPNETAHLADHARPAPSPDAVPQPGEHAPARRTVVAWGAAATLGVSGVAALAGCGSGSSGSSAAGSSAAGSSAAGSSAAGSSPGGPASAALAKLSDIPVGGAVAATASGSPIIIAQPAAGRVVAFSAACTHQGCKVLVAGTKLNCPCHGSVFNALTGQVLTGPATAALPSVPVKISGTDVVPA
jgi:Rieske Fe-S protein